MGIIELILLAIALAMDAFAVAICKGISSKQSPLKTGLVCGIWFGFFQALMPFLGWLLSSLVVDYVDRFSAYIAFALLTFLGIKMIAGAIGECKCGCEKADNKEEQKNASLAFGVMLTFAVATSIDALAAGVSFATMKANVVIAVSLIGVITFLFSFFGSFLGVKLGNKFRAKAEIFGGVILVALGLKILIEHFIQIL